MREGFYSKRGDRFRLSLSRKVISDFRKLDVSDEALCELLPYFLKYVVELTGDYGNIDKNFCISLENIYHKALKLMYKIGILEKYKTRALKIVNETDHMGWGFYDGLSDMYVELYEG